MAARKQQAEAINQARKEIKAHVLGTYIHAVRAMIEESPEAVALGRRAVDTLETGQVACAALGVKPLPSSKRFYDVASERVERLGLAAKPHADQGSVA